MKGEFGPAWYLVCVIAAVTDSLPPAPICPFIHSLRGTVCPRMDQTLTALTGHSSGQYPLASPPRTLHLCPSTSCFHLSLRTYET